MPLTLAKLSELQAALDSDDVAKMETVVSPHLRELLALAKAALKTKWLLSRHVGPAHAARILGQVDAALVQAAKAAPRG